MAYILFVDEIRDDTGELVVREAADYLASRGHSVTVLAEGGDAICYLREHRPDVLLCGLVLLDTTCEELARLVKKRYADTPPVCIAFTVISPGGEVYRDWTKPIDRYLLGRRTWDIVLVVESLVAEGVGSI